MHKFPTELLKAWFIKHKRHLPWRDNPTPYKVLISEMMLQQTQVSVVIPYFEKWMLTFPTIETLAKAPLEKVLKCWEGLGYYSRARNLHQAATFILQHHGGNLPSDREVLSKIKGIGPYTVGALLSFAFKQKAVAIDGNVVRVLSRFSAFDQEVDMPKSRMHLQKYAEQILPEKEPWLVVEGLIELGATICMKNPNCGVCPIKQECLSFRHALQHQLPRKRRRAPSTLLKRAVAVIHYKGHFLLRKGEEGRVMADLYEFPYVDIDAHPISDVVSLFEKIVEIPLTYVKALPLEKHTFTRYRVHLFPYFLQAGHLRTGFLWKSKEEMAGIPFSSGHRKILARISHSLF